MRSPTRRKACWSCRISKVRCDLSIPRCTNCARAGKNCQYGLRLSWPREGDARRSIVSRGSCRIPIILPENGLDLHFLNVGSFDVELHAILSFSPPYTCKHEFTITRLHQPIRPTPKSIPNPLSWRASGSGKFEDNLMSHYEEVLSAVLTSVHDRRIRGLLIAMSFIDSSPSSLAVQQALYALIALYVYGHIRAMQFKVKAITALNKSYRSSLDTKNGLQRIVAGLLLSLYEMLDSSNYSYQWEVYACGAKMVGNQIYSLDQVYEGDARAILDWLFYHDALFNFTTRHWKPDRSGLRACARDEHIRRAVLRSGSTSEIVNIIGCSVEVLETIAKICQLVPDCENPTSDSQEQMEALNRLERTLAYAKQYDDQEDESSQDESVKNIAELYRLAGLIYLYRAGKGFARNQPVVRIAVEAGLKIAASLKTCGRAFPILILGCEAYCDKDRLIILNLLRRTQECRKVGDIGNIVTAQRFIEASWMQDDLRTEEQLDYVAKLDAIISLSKYVPSFA